MEFLSGFIFKQMLKSGAANLANHQKEIDALNVFPVPDGDTGINMTMTFNNGQKEAENCASNSIGDVAKALSKGLLMGARGNSGVITSQIFRGFAKAVEGKEEINALEIAEAFENGAKVAYKAIMKPVEGTILTVIREGAWYAHHDFEENPNISIEEYFTNFLKYAEESLAHTPELLPVLKEVGVVDSGGTGLVKIIEGFKAFIDGKPVELNEANDEKDSSADLFGYNASYTLVLSDEYKDNFDDSRLLKKLDDACERVKVTNNKETLEIVTNCLKPGDVLNIGQRYGELKNIIITNNELGNDEVCKVQEEVKKEHKKFGIVVVTAGQGLTDIFYSLGVDVVITGGQTMNPSTENFVEKIKELDYVDEIFIFPNNSNIILAANQAKIICEDRLVHVVETRSIQEGISALTVFNPDSDAQSNLDEFKDVISNVQSASLTYAIKDTQFEGIEVKKGDYIAMTNKTIVSSSTDKEEVIKKLLDVLFEKKDAELLTVIYGEDYKPEELEMIKKYVSDNSSLELELLDGGQPVYSYLFGVE